MVLVRPKVADDVVVALLGAAPGAEGVLFDLPMVIDTLNTGDQPRLTLQAGDFFVDALPSAESYILM